MLPNARSLILCGTRCLERRFHQSIRDFNLAVNMAGTARYTLRREAQKEGVLTKEAPFVAASGFWLRINLASHQMGF